MIFNKIQQYVINEFVNFYHHSSEQIFQLAGMAGTGKTTVALAMIQAARIPMHRVKACAFVGQAAINLRRHGFRTARTLHSTLFSPTRQYLMQNGHIVYDPYYNKPIMVDGYEYKPLECTDLLLIDEGGFVPDMYRQEILSRGIKVAVLGDLGQLPPVVGKPAFFLEGKIYELTEIMRQSAGSNIVLLADLCRRGIDIPYGLFGNDVLVINEDEITDQMILGSDIVLCGKNKTRDTINKRVRDLLGIHSDLPVFGERLMCRKNNFGLEVDGISLANGLCGTVVNAPGVEGFDGKTYSIDFLPHMMTTPFMDIRADYNYLIAPFEERKKIKQDKYSVGEKFEFGYSSTVHSYQGSESANVLYMQENLGDLIKNQLDYTGVTRAKQSIIFAKRKKKFYAFY